MTTCDQCHLPAGGHVVGCPAVSRDDSERVFISPGWQYTHNEIAAAMADRTDLRVILTDLITELRGRAAKGCREYEFSPAVRISLEHIADRAEARLRQVTGDE